MAKTIKDIVIEDVQALFDTVIFLHGEEYFEEEKFEEELLGHELDGK